MPSYWHLGTGPHLELGGRRSISEENKSGGSVKHVSPGVSRSLWVFGGSVTFYALGEDTDGAFTLLEGDTAPQSAAFPHIHYEEDQAFYILEGEHEFVCDDRSFVTKAGSYVYVPRGTAHWFTNVGKMSGRIW